MINVSFYDNQMNRIDKTVCDCSDCVVRKLYFGTANSEEMASVCQLKSQFQFKKGEIITKTGDVLTDFAYLKSGLIQYYTILPNEKKQILTIVKPYETIGLLNIFNENKSVYYISALEDSTVCYIPLELITSMVKKNGNFALDFINKLSEASNTMLAQQLFLKSKNISGRIAIVLQHFAREIYHSNTFELPISRSDIASLIGMNTENVIRAMSEFRRDKIVAISGKQISILNPGKLSQIIQYG